MRYLDPWGRIWGRDAKARPLLHALEDEVDASGSSLAMRRCQGQDMGSLRTLLGHRSGSR